jgi:hypothetical protein
MKSSIKIIKNRPQGDVEVEPSGKTEKSVEQIRREMVKTVKSWIAEAEQRRRAEAAQSRAFAAKHREWFLLERESAIPA